MRILVFGGTGATGRHFLAKAVEAGHEVSAFVRDPQALSPDLGLKPIVGDARDASAVEASVAGHDALVSLLGPTGRERFQHFITGATRAMLDGMRKNGVKRLIVVSAVGVGDSRRQAPGFVRYFLGPVLLRATYADRTKAERVIQASATDWTLVRPVYLTNEPERRTWRVDDTGSDVSPMIPRADLAQFMVDELAAARYVRKAVAIGG